MSWLGKFLSSEGNTLVYGLMMGILGWVAVNGIGQPIITIRNKRLEALAIAEKSAYLGIYASGEEVKNAISVLGDVGISLRTYTRGQSWPARIYCHLLKYDLEMAASALFGLQRMVGESYSDEDRKNQLNFAYLSLQAHGHLTSKEVQELKIKIESAKAQKGVSKA